MSHTIYFTPYLTQYLTLIHNVLVVGYTMDTMYFAWQEQPVEIDKGLQLPQFELEDYILYDCSQNYTAGVSSTIHVKRCDSACYHLACYHFIVATF